MKVHSASSCYNPLSKDINQEKMSRGQKGRKERKESSMWSSTSPCRPFLGGGLHMVSETVCSNLVWYQSSIFISLCAFAPLYKILLFLKAIYKAHFRCEVILK